MIFNRPWLTLVALLISSLVIILTSSLHARDWKGLTPGASNRTEVIEKLGQPTKEINRGGSLSRGVVYQGQQKVEGTRQVQIFFNEEGIIDAMNVWPQSQITKEQIIKTYGQDFEEKLTDAFKPYLNYKEQGLVVFLQEGGKMVSSITYQRPVPKVEGSP